MYQNVDMWPDHLTPVDCRISKCGHVARPLISSRLEYIKI